MDMVGCFLKRSFMYMNEQDRDGYHSYILDPKISQLLLSKLLICKLLNKLRSYLREPEVTAILGVNK